jgi:hypothetical protein
MRGLSRLKRPSLFWVVAFAAFCAALLPLQLLATMLRIVAPIDLRPMTATVAPPGDVLIALALELALAVAVAAAAVAAALTFVGGGVGIHDIVELLGEIWV